MRFGTFLQTHDVRARRWNELLAHYADAFRGVGLRRFLGRSILVSHSARNVACIRGSGVKAILRELTPPLIWKLASSASRSSSPNSRKRPRRPTREVVVIDIEPTLLRYSVGAIVMPIPSHRLRYSGGLSFSYEQHHFLQYYAYGRDALKRYYDCHQPRDLFQEHFLSSPPIANIPNQRYPWIWSAGDVQMSFRGEEGLGPEHGRQQYGPVTPAKIDLEARRLDQVCLSIRDKGYEPTVAGYPRGYLLVESDGQWVFLVKGGQHRVAAMVHLGYQSINVCFHRNHPRVIAATEVHNWPLVRLGELTADEALMIFRTYFRPINTRLLD
jgi:hypothetical protein